MLDNSTRTIFVKRTEKIAQANQTLTMLKRVVRRGRFEQANPYEKHFLNNCLF